MTQHQDISERDQELLSAYLDGELSDRERRAFEQRLAGESDLRRALDELRATVRLVGALPRLKAPRSFALDPAMYGKRLPMWQRWLSTATMLQWSGALGTAASVILIVLGLALGSGDSDRAQHAPESAAASSATPAHEAASLPTAPPTALPITTPTTTAIAPAPFSASEADVAEGAEESAQTELAEPAEVPADAALTGPQAAAPPGAIDDAAPNTLGREGFAPPETVLPLQSERFAPQTESLQADDAASSAAADGERAGVRATGTLPPTQPPLSAGEFEAETSAPTVEETVTEVGTPGLKASGEPASESQDEARTRWWLVGLGALGLMLSAALFVVGRRQAGV